MSVSLISQIQIKFTVLKNKLPLLTSYFSYYFLLLLLKNLKRMPFHTTTLALAKALLDLTESLSHLLFFSDSKSDFECFSFVGKC